MYIKIGVLSFGTPILLLLIYKAGKMVFAGIVAGGCGSRMTCSEIPKQFIEIGGEAIIIRTLKSFLAVGEIDMVYIGIKADWHDYMDKLLARSDIETSRVCIVDGGSDRNGTVMNIVGAITERFGENDDDIILTHDAVRPFVSDKIIRDNISAAAKFSACGTYLHAVDTIVRSDGGIVESVLDRSCLFQAQTPQSFGVKALRKCYAGLSDEKKALLTDTCSIFTACGEDIYIVEGDVLNFKITTNNDLILANAVAGVLSDK